MGDFFKSSLVTLYHTPRCHKEAIEFGPLLLVGWYEEECGRVCVTLPSVSAGES